MHKEQPGATPQALTMVGEFHHTFRHPILASPQIPGWPRCALRINLLQEELDELKTAINAGDIVGVADALADLQYVLSGAVLEFGLSHAFYEIFCEVHRSNMSKACMTEQEAIDTVGLYTNRYTYVKEGDVWLVYRREDGKTVKSVNYSQADLKPIVKRHVLMNHPLTGDSNDE